MVKKITLLAILFALTFQVSYATVIPSGTPVTPPVEMVEIGYGVKVPADKLFTITPKEYKKLTGHRMGFFKAMGLKIAQKKIAKQAAKGKYAEGAGKSQLVALLLCFFVGTIGIHRFYLGYTWQGIVQILTLGGLGIWTLIDLIRIITGDLKPKNGEYEKTL